MPAQNQFMKLIDTILSIANTNCSASLSPWRCSARLSVWAEGLMNFSQGGRDNLAESLERREQVRALGFFQRGAQLDTLRRLRQFSFIAGKLVGVTVDKR